MNTLIGPSGCRPASGATSRKKLLRGGRAAAVLGMAITMFAGREAAAQESKSADPINTRLSSAFSDRGLRADDVAKRAVLTSHDVKSKGQVVLASEASLDQAKNDYIPRLTITGKYTRLSPIDQPAFGNIVSAPTSPSGPVPAGTPLVNVPLSVPVILDQAAAQAQLSIPVSDYLLRLGHKVDAAKHSTEAARLDAEATRRITATNAKIAYYDWARAKLQVIVADQSRAQAKSYVVDTKNRFEAGSGSQADVLRADSQLATTELTVERALAILARREDRLRTAVHDDALDLSAIGEDVRVDPPAIDLGGGAPRLVAEASQKRPELQALERSALAFHDQARAAKALYYPRLDAVADLTSASPNQRIFPQSSELNTTWSAGVVLSWSPSDAIAGGTSVRSAEAKEREAVEKRRALFDQLRAEVVDAYQALVETNAALVSARRGVAASEESHRVRMALYQAGRATSTEVLDAETDVLRTRLSVIDAYIDARLARVRLLHATGRDA
jgi:outer membrane protein